MHRAWTASQKKFRLTLSKITISLPSAGWQNSKKRWHASRLAVCANASRHARVLATGDEFDGLRGAAIVSGVND
jgi:hypothetical protein